ncbi:MAG: exodeoxyribonuclease-3 [Maribacter sp.]|jgi:exodeoxyribonuclease-3
MKIILWSVNGIRAAVKKDFFRTLQNLDPDILCLQETKAQNNEVSNAIVVFGRIPSQFQFCR